MCDGWVVGKDGESMADDETRETGKGEEREE